MRTFFLLALALFGMTTVRGQHSSVWFVNYEEALASAKVLDRPVLVSFSGSDWCNNCMRLSKELFETTSFLRFADENLILLNLDFPAKKQNKLSKELTEQNDQLAEKFNKKGSFPLTLLLNKHGQLIGPMDYPLSSVEDYLENIDQLIE
ncbi:thioredoxin family protein [Chitinophagales bacterium]|nr:thioredoxin family protein [Chitinophagales bacterium]